MSEEINKTEGHDKLWLYFGLSYASWLTLPRALMHEMPDEWQGKMADLMDEWHKVYTNMPDIETVVSLKKEGKFIQTPEYLINYRHPHKKKINLLKCTRATIEDE